MAQHFTQEQEERVSGTTVALFAIFITFIALFVCVLVTVLTVRSRPSSGGVNPTESGIGLSDSGTGSGSGNTTPPGPSVPVFSPTSATVRPYTTANSKTVSSEITSNYAVLVDAETGEILAGKGADTRFKPASMTKIMTLLVACERLTDADLDATVEYTRELRDYVTGIGNASRHWGAGSESEFGDRIAVKDLLYGIGVESAADCVMMVVCYLAEKSPAESEALFVQWMNDEAKVMGLEKTHFENVTGADNENHYSTAIDMAAILIRALDCQLISDILSQDTEYQFPIHYTNESGQPATYTGRFYSTLFNANASRSSRIKSYEDEHGKGSFTLKRLRFKGGKTGTLDQYSLASYAVDPQTGKIYILITGETSRSLFVMEDAKKMYDSYAP